MMYVIMAVLGAAIGWYLSKTKENSLAPQWMILLGVAGGLIGGGIATLFSFAAVILFKLVLAVLGAYLLIFFVQYYMKQKG